MIEDAKKTEGKNLTVWFPDAEVADQLAELANGLKTSSSAVIYELVRKAMPAIKRNKDQRAIPLDGVTVEV